MREQAKEILQQQKKSWNAFSPGWKKWDELTMDFLKPLGDETIRLINPKNSDKILDVAAGTGEPGLTIAEMIPEGSVTITDLSEDMLAIAKESAAKRKLANVETQIADASQLPFADNAFDAISCRLGFMYFPDMTVAAMEMARVLKPGGKIAASVWGAPEKNLWATILMGTIKEHMELPAPSKEKPGLFRCAEPGFVADMLKQAGLTNISEKEVIAKLHCETAETYWEMMNEIAPPVAAAVNEADETTVEKIKNEVKQKLHAKYPGGNIQLDANALIVYGEKPS